MSLTTEKSLNYYFNLHKMIFHLNNNVDENIEIPISYTTNETINQKHLNKMFQIENSYSTETQYYPFGIVSSVSSYYRNNLILSLCHPQNRFLSPLYNSIEKKNIFISEWSYINETVDDTNTLNTTIIVTPVQSLIPWLECSKDASMNIKIISTNKDLNNLTNTNYDVIIVTTNIWNNFVINPLIVDKYIARLILDDIHLFNVTNARYIKFKFVWMLTEYMEDLLYYVWNNYIWDANFANNCITIFDTKAKFMSMIEESKNFDSSHMTDDYINSFANDIELIKLNLSYLLKNNKIWNINKYYNTPLNIFKYSREQIKSFNTFKIKRGFFTDLLNGFVQTSFESESYNHILYYKNYSYSMFNINVELVNCIMEFSPESVDIFIKRDLSNILNGDVKTLNRYFDCYSDISSLKQSNTFISDTGYYNIDERLSHNLGCPICYESITDDMIITGCCKHVFHHKCLLSCFKNNIVCPMCRAIVPMNKSYVVNEHFINVVKTPTQIEVLINLLKSDMTKRILIVDSIHYINILTYKIKTFTHGQVDAYLLSENVKEIYKLYDAKNSDKKVAMVCMTHCINKYKSLDLGDIDTLILYNNENAVVSDLLPQLMSPKRTQDLNIYYLNIDINLI
jgi:hypothetical protein